MDVTQAKTQKKETPAEPDPTKINRNAPTGSETSLGAESVRDDRPSTDDSVVEAMDRETPGRPEPKQPNTYPAAKPPPSRLCPAQ